MHVTLHSGFAASLDRLATAVPSRSWDLVIGLLRGEDAERLDLRRVAGARDGRVRTARLDDRHGVVAFVVGDGRSATVVLARAGPYEQALTWARTATLGVDPDRGSLELHLEASEPKNGETSAGEPTGSAAVSGQDVIDLRDGVHPASGRGGDMTTGAPSAVGSDADVLDALRQASSADFAVVTDDVDLSRVLAGDFAAWKLFLHPLQRAIAFRSTYSGPFRLTGGPGTGKTVVALHRTHHLVRRAPGRRILLCTYNRTLADNLRDHLVELVGSVPPGVDVLGVEQLPPRVLTEAGRPARSPVGDQDDLTMWRGVVAEVGGLPELLVPDPPSFVRDEYRYVILLLGLRATAEDYLAARRQGRSTLLRRDQRMAVWRAVEVYRERYGPPPTYAHQAAAALDALRDDQLVRALQYDHAVVDEGQDLQPLHWSLLRRLVPRGENDLFICEDAHQRLYGPPIALSRLGIETRGRSRRLTINYRTTHQILGTAVRVLEGAAATDLEGGAEPAGGQHSRLSGSEPRVVTLASSRSEIDFATRLLRDWLRRDRPGPGELAVLVRRNAHASDIATRLRRAGVPARHVTQRDPGGSEPVHVMTMHRAKGSEYARVVVVKVDDDVVPDPRALAAAPADELDDVLARERFLLYVACTRARDELVVTCTGRPSRFLGSVLAARSKDLTQDVT